MFIGFYRVTRDFPFLQIANGPLFERQTQLEIGSHPGFVSNHDFEKLSEKTREIVRMIGSLIKKVE